MTQLLSRSLITTVMLALCVSMVGSPALRANTLPTFIPKAPHIEAKQSILLDASSGKVLSSQDENEQIAPASLTKMMTLYVIFHALKNGQINLDEAVRIPIPAWKMKGSRMFLEPHKRVPVKDLIEGIIVVSGNDACVAMAHHLAGSEAAFADMMNQTAAYLGMQHTHFTDSTGLPHPDHYSTASDLALLSRALIRDFPEYYHFFKIKKLTYNKITQTNRNILLWRDPRVDGLKTGHTEEAGYCLASSALSGPTRLIAVTLGSPSEAARARANQSLLTWGFRFYETSKLYSAHQAVVTRRVWHGEQDHVALGVTEPVYITLPQGRRTAMKVTVNNKTPELEAPIHQGKVYATATVRFKDDVITQVPLVALDDVSEGGAWTRLKDSIARIIHHWLH